MDELSKAFCSILQSSKSSDQLIKEIENITIMYNYDIQEQKNDLYKKFVLKEKTNDCYKLYMVDYMSFLFKWVLPIELSVEDKENGEGSIIYYKLENKNVTLSNITAFVSALMFIAGIVWLACATCVSFDVFGIIISILLMVVPQLMGYIKISFPMKKAKEILASII